MSGRGGNCYCSSTPSDHHQHKMAALTSGCFSFIFVQQEEVWTRWPSLFRSVVLTCFMFLVVFQRVTVTVTLLTVTTTLRWIRGEQVWMSTDITEGAESVSTVR